jgi:hypothetical protein
MAHQLKLPLLIKEEFDRKQFYDTLKMLYKLQSHHDNRYIVWLLGIALSFLLFGGLLRAEFQYCNPLFIIGFTVLFMVIIFAFSARNHKIKYLQKTEKIGKEIAKYGDSTSLTLTEEGIRYQDSINALELSWGIILGWTKYKDHLLIVVNENLTSSIVLSKKEENKELFTQAEAIVKEKLEYLKVK